MTDLRTRGSRLKYLRKYRQLGQKEFAGLLERSKGYISLMESDKQPLTMAVIEGLYQSFAGLNINWLLYGTGKMLLEMEPPMAEALAEPVAPYERQSKEGSWEELRREVDALRKEVDALKKAAKKDE